MHKTKYLLAGLSSILFLSIALIAQRGPGQPQAGPGANAPSTSAGIESVKALIKATDAEWHVIGPRLQAVVTARQSVVTYTAAAPGRGGLGGGGFPDFGGDSFAGPVGDSPGFGGRGGSGGPGGRGGFDPASFFGGRGGPEGASGRGGFDPASFFGGRGGPEGASGRGGPGGGAPWDFGPNNNAVSMALAELKTALADPSSSPEQVKAKLAAVRSARQKAVTDLAAAQKGLLPLLTAGQEATLVSLGYLD